MRRQRFRFENRLLRLVREEEDQLIHSVARLVIRLPLPPRSKSGDIRYRLISAGAA
jgi:hypothetical protein